VAVLIVERGTGKGTAVPVPEGKTVVLGREGSCDFVVSGDPMVSRKHCRVVARGDHVLVTDLGSSNGTQINGQRIEAQRESVLEHEDQLQLGQTVFALVPDQGGARHGELTGRKIGGYEVGERIGRGAMGVVYRARQISLDRTVALKILAREHLTNPHVISLFKSEAKAAGRLNHPNIVSVFDVGTDGETHYFSMESMERGSCEDLLQANGGRLDLDTALRVAIDAAKGLAYAERQGIVHRDIKPANLMINSEGATKIGDLGIARRIREGEGDESISGSPHYLAPEQAKGGQIDHRADLYALGVTLYRMLAGELPFEGRSVRDVILKHMNEEPPRLEDVAPEVPEEAAGLVAELLAKLPEDRPDSADLVRERLEGIRRRYVEGATGAGAFVEGDPAQGRGRRAIALGVGALLLVAGLTLVLSKTGGSGGEADGVGPDAAAIAEAARRDREAQEAAAAQAQRRRDAQAALATAHQALAADAADLQGARERYLAVAETYSDQEAIAKEARDRVATIDESIGRLSVHRREQEERATKARERAQGLLDRAKTAEGPELKGVLDQVRLAISDKLGGEAEVLLKQASREVLVRVESQASALEKEAAEHLAAGRFAEASALAERMAAWGLDEFLASRADRIRQQVSAAERQKAESVRLAAEALQAEELARVVAAIDAEAAAAFDYQSVLDGLRGLEDSLADPSAKQRLADEVSSCRAALAFLEVFGAHLESGAEPKLVRSISKSMRGVAIGLDRQRVRFAALEHEGVEVAKTFGFVGADAIESVASRLALEPEARFGLARMLTDLGDEGAAREVLETLLGELTSGALQARVRRALQ
jgi:serine/threonine-protein kinase